MLFKGHMCLWHEECDVIPADGCTCFVDDNQHVICTDLDLTVMPPIGNISVDYLDISENRFTEIGDGFFGECTMKELVINYNKNTLSFMKNVLSMAQKATLERLHLTHNSLYGIPEFLQNMPILRILDLSYNELTTIGASSLDGLINLYRLDLRGNPISYVSKLVYLDIDNIHELTFTFGKAVTQGEDEDYTEIFGSNDVGTIYSFHGISSLELYDTTLERVQFL
jgi:hypothetical protein